MFEVLKGLKAAMSGTMMKITPGMITCEQFDQLITDYYDDNLTKAQRRTFERHLYVCPHCQEYMRAYNESRKMAALSYKDHYEDDDVLPDDVPDELVHAVLQTLKEEK